MPLKRVNINLLEVIISWSATEISLINIVIFLAGTE